MKPITDFAMGALAAAPILVGEVLGMHAGDE